MSKDRTCGQCRHWRDPEPVWDDKANAWKPGDWHWCEELVVTDAFHPENREVVSLAQARAALLSWRAHLRTREHFGCSHFAPLAVIDADDDRFWEAA